MHWKDVFQNSLKRKGDEAEQEQYILFFLISNKGSALYFSI